MSNFKLNLPTDIPWERICVTEDMIDQVICDDRLPGKWQTSMAVFKYRPDDEFQLYPKYNMTYLKVTASITGYQPLDKEIQGQIDWEGVDVSTIEGLTDLLNSYNPCHGAILQVVVGPASQRSDIPLSEYPFFMDYEPKKRELYELATDTNEKSSRSIESLNITKSSGNTQSMEVMDIDMGGDSIGAQALYAGTGGGFSYSSPNGQWGTRRLNSDESLASRSTDVGQEKRETFSYSTQLSQMYHLLNSYHLGTNRVVFFIQPRPHTLEEPSGFVRGPRPVEGIQEFFLIVAQPKDQDDFCVSLRLDTSHLTKTPIMDYERKSETTEVVNATAPVASKSDIPAEYKVGARACFISCWDVWYQCYRTEKKASYTYNAPAGYRIESFNNLINEASNGSSTVVITPNGATLNINAEAHGHICYEDSGVCVNCPDEIEKYAGSARRQVQVNLVSTTPTRQTGEEEVLMITTRGLCCCMSRPGKYDIDEFVVGIKTIPNDLSVTKYLDRVRNSERKRNVPWAEETTRKEAHSGHDCKECSEKASIRSYEQTASYEQPSTVRHEQPDSKYTIRLANELSNFIKTESIKSLNDPNVKLQKYVETDFFAKQLEYKLVQFRKGRDILNESIVKDIPREAIPGIEKHFGKKANEITRQHLLSLRKEQLEKITGIKSDTIQKIKLGSLGIKMKKENVNPTKENKRGKNGGPANKKAD